MQRQTVPTSDLEYVSQSAGKDCDGEREQGATLARCKWTGQVALVLSPATDGDDDIMDAPKPGKNSRTLLLQLEFAFDTLHTECLCVAADVAHEI